MTLKFKLTIVMTSVMILMASLNYIVLRSIVLPSFEDLERDEAVRNVNRAERAIKAEIAAIGRGANDWSHWDETYEFVAGNNPNYVNIIKDETFGNLNIHVMCFYDVDGNLVWGRGYDYEAGQDFSTDEFNPGLTGTARAMVGHLHPGGSVEGIVNTTQGPLLFGAKEVLTSNNQGPARGTLLFGRLLRQSSTEALRERVEVGLDVWPVDAMLPTELRDVLNGLTDQDPDRLIHDYNGVLSTFSVYRNILGSPALLVRTDVPRDATNLGERTVWFAMISLAVVAFTDMILIWLLLRFLVLRPVLRLERHISKISRTGNFTDRLPDHRTDEIGSLAREFNAMAGRLTAFRRELEEQSYLAGRAESASGALHNVRNTLNPLVNRLDGLSRDLEDLPGRQVARAAREFHDPATPVERRARLGEYLQSVGDALDRTRAAMSLEVKEISRHAVSIGEILDSQAGMAYLTKPFSAVSLSEIFTDAAQRVRERFGEFAVVVMDPSISAIPEVLGERIGLSQVALNLLTNAVEAIAAAGRATGRITVRGGLVEVAGSPMVLVQVEDNGAGIEHDELTAIFGRGISSKGTGRGVGLHWCANTIARMQGQLSARSPGAGQGATFELRLPAALETV